MIRRSRLMQRSALLLVTVMVLQLTSCGYLLYPERRGQVGGNIDAGVAVLDALGLIFFIIPGVVAFAVDFSTGAIYLPPGSANAVPRTLDPDETVVVQVTPEELAQGRVEAVVGTHIGEEVDLDSEIVRVYKSDDAGKLSRLSDYETVPYASEQDS